LFVSIVCFNCLFVSIVCFYGPPSLLLVVANTWARGIVSKHGQSRDSALQTLVCYPCSTLVVEWNRRTGAYRTRHCDGRWSLPSGRNRPLKRKISASSFASHLDFHPRVSLERITKNQVTPTPPVKMSHFAH
jgi:hypothetical protein